ncbi:hypothetical protein I316_03084 [Kwoniella heveanensis BCC8398]|uniref:Probable RNA polymerase II nuclear localization protein SLC7A6OS n=1 Tax=Kwoniella heveanensis BCC8398 TaxID=1296120 RepID=A0A1B9GVI5_9TREE|nr:hypothetical protein I316_03084 [Kwoniella heveanensis BCC8398]
MNYPQSQFAGPSSSSSASYGLGTGAGPTSTSAEAGSYTVLRIKRKATDAPLSSLVIQDLEPRLRNTKRRRDVSGRPRGVFRLAETVPDTWKGRGQEGEVLKSRIQNLLSSSSQPDSPITPTSPLNPPAIPATTASPVHPTTSLFEPVDTLASTSKTVAEGSRRETNAEDECRGTKSASAPTVRSAPPTTNGSSAGPSQTQFRVVPPLSPRTKAMMPPRLLTTAETEGDGSSSPLVFVDAQAVSPTKPRTTGKPINHQEEKDMAAFLPMLEEYLKFEESQSKPPSPKVEPAEDEWVYDLYYRDNRNAGSAPLGLGAGDGVSIGELLGFEDISPPSSISGSEPEDEADEDSNDEDYYRNDYPEDEDADEDMEGFRPGYDDDDDEAEEEDEWSDSDYGDQDNDDRGEWGYRG